jgi:hypothetical protein
MFRKESGGAAGHLQEGHWGQAVMYVVFPTFQHLHCFSISQHSSTDKCSLEGLYMIMETLES